MTVELLFCILGGIASIIGCTIASTRYIGAKFDDLGNKLTQVQLDAKDHVTYATCSAHRHNCPLKTDVDRICKLLEKKK